MQFTTVTRCEFTRVNDMRRFVHNIHAAGTMHPISRLLALQKSFDVEKTHLT